VKEKTKVKEEVKVEEKKLAKSIVSDGELESRYKAFLARTGGK